MIQLTVDILSKQYLSAFFLKWLINQNKYLQSGACPAVLSLIC